MNDPAPVPAQPAQPPDMTLGELLVCVIGDESAQEHNRRVVAQATARNSTEGFLMGAYAAALSSGDPYAHIPSVSRLRAYANNEFGLDLTPEALRWIRGRVCEALDIDTIAADAIPLARVVEVLRVHPADTPPGDDLASQFRWLRVRDVSRVFAPSAGHVSRLADDGTFVTNGRTGYERRIDALSVIRWVLDRLNRQGDPDTDRTD